jgi:transcriptional regulator MraZ
LAFNGNFEHTLDAKHRLTVPSKFRTQLAGPVFLVKGVDRCISVYPEQTYSAMTEAALAGLNPFSPEARELRRFFHGNAADVELDSAGRVMLPPSHREHAGIDRSPGDDRWRGGLARALGSGRLEGLRHRPHGASA